MSDPGSYSRHDIRHISFEDFVTFLFDHDVVPVPRDKKAGPFPWYWSVTVDYDPRAVIAYYTRLFAAPRFLLAQFPVDQLEWDSLAFDWECGNRSRANGGEDQAMQDVMFATLARILDLRSETCQAAALHGLGHLHHPETAELIQGYLSRNSAISPDLRDYAMAAARFEVM